MGDTGKATAAISDVRISQRRYFFWEPLWDFCRADPRFDAAVVRLGCVEEYRTARATLARLQAERRESAR
jgi:hypothetical protein